MNSGATADRVYAAIKRHVLSGVIGPGQRLDPVTFATELSSSVTPVRDALNRLIGETLVETRSSEGFYMPQIHEPALRDLYLWNAQLLQFASRSWKTGNELAPASLPNDPLDATAALFRLFAERTGNSEFITAIQSVSERLQSARVVEAALFADRTDELTQLVDAFERGSPAINARNILVYHRRRVNVVPAIVRALYGNNGP